MNDWIELWDGRMLDRPKEFGLEVMDDWIELWDGRMLDRPKEWGLEVNEG